MATPITRSDYAGSLFRYFSRCTGDAPGVDIGMEVETSFVDSDGKAVPLSTSRKIFEVLAECGWHVAGRNGGLITKLERNGDIISFELGRQNIELSARPAADPVDAVAYTRSVLFELYEIAKSVGAFPHFAPILETAEDLLVIPDERDATWLSLDGRESLAPLATTSAVQFSIGVTPETAIPLLNRLGRSLGTFLADYPQDKVWKTYIETSLAGYRSDRYGGPLLFRDLRDYCEKLVVHDVVTQNGLVSIEKVRGFTVTDFLRSVWWYFRLRRHGDRLCIEVRPLPRRTDTQFERQLELVLRTMDL